MIKEDRKLRKEERAERLAERREARRQWLLEKPRPLVDLVKNSTGLIKWLLLAAALAYLFFNGSNWLGLLGIK